MIPQSGETSFNVCLAEVGLNPQEYGVEELFTYMNQWASMIAPYYTAQSFDDLKGFMGVIGNVHFKHPRYITSTNVWHYMEIWDAYVIDILIGADPPVWRPRSGVAITFVNHSVTTTGIGDVDIEIYTRPGGDLIYTTLSPIDTPIRVSLSKSRVVMESDPPVISYSTSMLEINWGQTVNVDITIYWRWSDLLPWNSLIA